MRTKITIMLWTSHQLIHTNSKTVKRLNPEKSIPYESSERTRWYPRGVSTVLFCWPTWVRLLWLGWGRALASRGKQTNVFRAFLNNVCTIRLLLNMKVQWYHFMLIIVYLRKYKSMNNWTSIKELITNNGNGPEQGWTVEQTMKAWIIWRQC